VRFEVWGPRYSSSQPRMRLEEEGNFEQEETEETEKRE
jgi:hypothetical protein